MSSNDDIKNIEEQPNYPNPARLRVWGEDMMIGRVIANEEAKSEGGIIMPLNIAQDYPHAATITQVSDQVSGKYPRLKPGITVFIALGTGDRWRFGRDKSGREQEYIRVHARNIMGDYDPWWNTSASQAEKGDVTNV